LIDKLLTRTKAKPN